MRVAGTWTYQDTKAFEACFEAFGAAAVAPWQMWVQASPPANMSVQGTCFPISITPGAYAPYTAEERTKPATRQ